MWLLPVLLVLVLAPLTASAKRSNSRKAPEVIYSYDGPNVRIYSSEVTDTLRMFFIADTHLWMSDEREEPFRQYSKRMASLYYSHYVVSIVSFVEVPVAGYDMLLYVLVQGHRSIAVCCARSGCV